MILHASSLRRSPSRRSRVILLSRAPHHRPQYAHGGVVGDIFRCSASAIATWSRRRADPKAASNCRTSRRSSRILRKSPTKFSSSSASVWRSSGYQRRILDPEKPPDLGYTYGNRLRGYFRRDGETGRFSGDRRPAPQGKARIAPRLYRAMGQHARPARRHRHSLLRLGVLQEVRWQADADRDLPLPQRDGGWPKTFMADRHPTLRRGQGGHGARPADGVSHSISIDVSSLEKARKIASSKESDEVYAGHRQARPPHGSERRVHHHIRPGDVGDRSRALLQRDEVGEYRGKSAEEIERQLARDVAISRSRTRCTWAAKWRARNSR